MSRRQQHEVLVFLVSAAASRSAVGRGRPVGARPSAHRTGRKTYCAPAQIRYTPDNFAQPRRCRRDRCLCRQEVVVRKQSSAAYTHLFTTQDAKVRMTSNPSRTL